jgi:hypothetical protein
MHSARNRKSIVTAAYENHEERLLCNSCCTVLKSGHTASAISAQEVGHLMFMNLAGYYSFELLTEEFGCKGLKKMKGYRYVTLAATTPH